MPGSSVLDFFTVEFNSEDEIIGPIMALFSLSHVFVLMALGSAIVLRRELHSISIFVGLCVCELLCRVLKKSLKNPRPQGNSLEGSV